jgi:BioD-like phosphotransacetylase family protein
MVPELARLYLLPCLILLIMNCPKIYVAATSQHVGKTTSTLGLLNSLRQQGLKVGYCKPLGQQFIDVGPSRVDKDALLFSKFMDFDLVPELHSPVILGSGATTAFLDNPKAFNYGTKILKASKILQQNYDTVVYEGTGHPGVGSVVGLSNAKVADMLGAGLIMVVEAGIGNTIDRLDLNLSVFEQKKIPVLGIIINKAQPQKIDKVKHYVGRVLKERKLPLLGIIPFEEELALPLMDTIAKAINAEVVLHSDMLDNKIKGIIAGSLIDMSEMKDFDHQLLVVSINRLEEALKKLTQVTRLMSMRESPLSGVILTGQGDMSPSQVAYIKANKIPVLRSKIDTYEAVIKISRIEVKINVRTPWKVRKAMDLFEAHVDLSPVLNRLG